MSRAINMEVSDELMKLICSEEEIGKEANQALVMDLVRKGKISRSKAAELLGISLWDLPELLSRYEIPWFTYSKENYQSFFVSAANGLSLLESIHHCKAFFVRALLIVLNRLKRSWWIEYSLIEFNIFEIMAFQ